MKHEHEITELLHNEQLDILFLTETDSYLIDEEFKILNFKAITHNKSSQRQKTRILALVNDNIWNDIKKRDDLDISNYPIINIETKLKNNKKIIITGLYRQWGNNQENEMDQICMIFDKIGDETLDHIIIGDINLDKSRYHEANYRYKSIRDKILTAIYRNDLQMADLGPTYLSKSNGCQSEIDHIYFSSTLQKSVITYTGDCCASDHLQIIIDVNIEKNIIKKETKKYKVIRSYKNFDQSNFNRDLSTKHWEKLGLTEDVDEMVRITYEFFSETLEKRAPQKRVQIHKNHIFGLSEQTRSLIKERNKARKK